MKKIYAAIELSDNEYLVLDALTCAEAEGETPCNWTWLSEEYESLSDVTESIVDVLYRLQARSMAKQEIITTLWSPTQWGRDVMQFAEKTAREEL